MPATATLPRIQPVDFFAVWVPGAYVVGCACVAIFGGLDPLWVKEGMPVWLRVSVALYVSYLLGSVIRAFPVDGPDRVCGWLVRFVLLPPIECVFSRSWKSGPVNVEGSRKSGSARRSGRASTIPEKLSNNSLVYRERFPYPRLLRRRYEQLRRGADVPKWLRDAVDAGKAGDPHVHFDYWATCVSAQGDAPAGRVRELETRTRLVAGMLWAGILSVIALILRMALSSKNAPLAPPLLGSSIALALIFGWRLRSVRATEARGVFLAYLYHVERPQPPRAAAGHPADDNE
jgi:hypothetical protein